MLFTFTFTFTCTFMISMHDQYACENLCVLSGSMWTVKRTRLCDSHPSTCAVVIYIAANLGRRMRPGRPLSSPRCIQLQWRRQRASRAHGSCHTWGRGVHVAVWIAYGLSVDGLVTFSGTYVQRLSWKLCVVAASMLTAAHSKSRATKIKRSSPACSTTWHKMQLSTI